MHPFLGLVCIVTLVSYCIKAWLLSFMSPVPFFLFHFLEDLQRKFESAIFLAFGTSDIGELMR